MSKKEDFDVIIIGSGVSGLVCGCYLQKAGLKVAILESREEAGGGRMASEMMRPGYFVEQCIYGDYDPMMMHQLNLSLDKYGYDEIWPGITDWGWGYAFEDGTCLINHPYDIQKFSQKVKRFSEKDANKLSEIGSILAEPYEGEIPRGVIFQELLLTEPWTWENFERLIDLIAPILPFSDPYEVTDINGFEMVDLMFESDQLKVFCLSVAIGSAFYPFNTGGSGAIGALFWPLASFVSHPKYSCHSVAHVYIRCFRALGGKLFNSCPVKKIIVAGGEAKGVVLDDHAAFPRKEITAKKVVTNLNPRLTFTELIDEKHVSKRLIHKLKTNWKVDGILFPMYWALKERPRFASEKFDPDIVHIAAGGMGAQTLRDMIHNHGERMAGRIPETPMQEFGLPHKADPTQAGKDNFVMMSDWHVPYTMFDRGGPQMWDDRGFRKEMAEKAIDTWETYCPGFRENIIDYWMTTPLDLERKNPNYMKGCMCGGSPAAHQMFYGNRAAIEGFEKGGIITPIKNLYGSGSVGLGSSAGSNGYVVACHIAEELGIRNQPWWTHRVFEYVTKKYIQKTYVPLKPTSILDKD